MIAYLPESMMPIEDALNSVEDSLYVVKDGLGRAYWPAYGINQIGDMQPGSGYQIYMNAAGALLYPNF